MQQLTTKQIKRVWWSMPGIMQWYPMDYIITLQPTAISNLKIKQMNAITIRTSSSKRMTLLTCIVCTLPRVSATSAAQPEKPFPKLWAFAYCFLSISISIFQTSLVVYKRKSKICHNLHSMFFIFYLNRINGTENQRDMIRVHPITLDFT